MTPRRFTPKADTPDRWRVAFVLSLLLATQWLSLTHAIAHATRACGHSEPAARCEATTNTQASWTDTVSSIAAHHDDNSPLCRLLDHLCHATPVPSVPEVVAQRDIHPLPEIAKIGRWTSLAPGHYSARAPPALS